MWQTIARCLVIAGCLLWPAGRAANAYGVCCLVCVDDTTQGCNQQNVMLCQCRCNCAADGYLFYIGIDSQMHRTCNEVSTTCNCDLCPGQPNDPLRECIRDGEEWCADLCQNVLGVFISPHPNNPTGDACEGTGHEYINCPIPNLGEDYCSNQATRTCSTGLTYCPYSR